MIAKLGQFTLRTSRKLIVMPRCSIYYHQSSLRASGFIQGRTYSTTDKNVKKYPSHEQLMMPALSPTMTSGNLATWKKQIGDAIRPGDIIAEIETDKATMDFEAQEDGFLAKILVKEGSKDILVNQPIAIIVDSLDKVVSFKDFELAQDESTVKKIETETVKSADKPKETNEAITGSPVSEIAQKFVTPENDRVKASPMAKSMAKQNSIDLSLLTGTGPSGRIVKKDIEAKLNDAASSTISSNLGRSSVSSGHRPRTFKDIELSNMRQTIAKRLSESTSTIPHFYLTSEVKVEQLQSIREQLNKSISKPQKLSINDFIIKAVALTLRQFPQVNASWMGTKIRQYDYIDVSVAVSTESGLITPIVHNADQLSVMDISGKIKLLAQKAKENKLKPEEFQGGTFTVSNLGMFGISQFTAIINPPQSCILAVGGVEKRLTLDPFQDFSLEEDTQQQSFSIESIMKVTMSCDHRVVDGALGAQFLQKLKEYLESPLLLVAF